MGTGLPGGVTDSEPIVADEALLCEEVWTIEVVKDGLPVGVEEPAVGGAAGEAFEGEGVTSDWGVAIDTLLEDVPGDGVLTEEDDATLDDA